MNAPLYTMEILRLAASLPAPRRLDRVDGWAERRSPTCGSLVRTEVQIGRSGRIEAVSQHVLACAFGQASAALLASAVEGRTPSEVADALTELDAWLGGFAGSTPAWPGIATLAPVLARRSRHGAVRLPFEALVAAANRSRS